MKERDQTGMDEETSASEPAGILIRSGGAEPESKPTIAAYIWGGKVRPEPTLPFGRWKPTAA